MVENYMWNSCGCMCVNTRVSVWEQLWHCWRGSVPREQGRRMQSALKLKMVSEITLSPFWNVSASRIKHILVQGVCRTVSSYILDRFFGLHKFQFSSELLVLLPSSSSSNHAHWLPSTSPHCLWSQISGHLSLKLLSFSFFFFPA